MPGSGNRWSLLKFKYHNAPVGMSVAHEVEEKVQRLGGPPEIAVEPVLISAVGATQAVHRGGLFNNVLTLKDLVDPM